jgi:AP2-associated kinase
MKGTRKPASEGERNALIDELSEQTTLIYRAPEMLDLFRGQEIGPPSDVWALGCTV